MPKRFGDDNIIDAGTLSPVSIMLTAAGIYVRPKPLNIPTVVISIHINN